MTDAVEAAGAIPASDIAPAAERGPAVAGPAAGADPARAESDGKRGPLRATAHVLLDGARTIALALALSFAIRVLVIEPFHIPSASMEPTLVAGDYIGAAKYAYGWSRVSTAPITLPMIPGRLLGRDPVRGDVVVFRNRLDNDTDYVKRVIGLPGDRVQMRDGILHLNGEAMPTALVDSYAGFDPLGAAVTVNVYEETLPSGCVHRIQHFDYPDGREEGQDDTYEFLVPEGHYFMLGDNRDASYDSRLPGRVGYVPAAEVVGRAEFVFLSMTEPAAGAGLQEEASSPTLRLDRTLKRLPCP